jgi:hypothetical protein
VSAERRLTIYDSDGNLREQFVLGHLDDAALHLTGSAIVIRNLKVGQRIEITEVSPKSSRNHPLNCLCTDCNKSGTLPCKEVAVAMAGPLLGEGEE